MKLSRTLGNRSAGMTLIEAVIWIGIFTFTMAGLWASVIHFYQANSYTFEQSSAIYSAQRGIDSLVKTIREASYASNGAYPIVSIGQYNITFYADVNSNSAIERVTYSMASTTLYQYVVGPVGNPPAYTGATSSVIAADYVRNIDQGTSIFTYYDRNGAEITNYSRIGDVRFVVTNIIVDVNPNDQPGRLTLRSSAALRNLVGH